MARDDARIGERWRRCLRERPRDLDLHHDLAVLYRERALRQTARTGRDQALGRANRPARDRTCEPACDWARDPAQGAALDQAYGPASYPP
ncbi:hypothetical protein [Actinomadura pelletieri]|uniref:hypothetical protein n=1 Tax=Actinomadura pelletieri TaxID=111805 RepID=UPI0011C3DF24|nr:hypothetical protein [Actinomadura pelletieri]